jgi:hypothetical protein
VSHRIVCKSCGRVLHDAPQGRPCPNCGSTARRHELTLESAVEVDDAQPFIVRVLRGVTPVRLGTFLTLLTFAVGTGLTVGLACSAWLGVAVGLAAFAALALLLWVLLRGGRLTHWVMELMHRITGQ